MTVYEVGIKSQNVKTYEVVSEAKKSFLVETRNGYRYRLPKEGMYVIRATSLEEAYERRKLLIDSQITSCEQQQASLQTTIEELKKDREFDPPLQEELDQNVPF